MDNYRTKEEADRLMGRDQNNEITSLRQQAATLTYAARQASKVPEGWKLVPVEPTPEMLKASLHESKCRAWQIYKWMISASPSQETGE